MPIFLKSPEDKFRFGDYLSGLTDGEGHFSLLLVRYKGRYRFRGRFVITLRADDRKVLEMAKEYLGCGIVSYRCRWKKSKDTHNPQVVLVVSGGDCISKVIPHFDAHPLYAKKKKDYRIWRKGMILWDGFRHRSPIFRGGGRGFEFRWTQEEFEEFKSLCERLKRVRRFSI